MKKIMTLAASIAVVLSAGAQSADFFQPYKTTDLRLPSVPIFVNDPYVSFWSPYASSMKEACATGPTPRNRLTDCSAWTE